MNKTWFVEATNQHGTKRFGPYTEKGSRVVHSRLSTSGQYYMIRSYDIEAERLMDEAGERIKQWGKNK